MTEGLLAEMRGCDADSLFPSEHRKKQMWVTDLPGEGFSFIKGELQEARLQFMERHGSPPSFIADANEMAEIDKELGRLEPIVTSKLLALYYPDH